MAGKILGVKPVEPPPSCVRKSTRLCYIFTYEKEGWKERTCLHSTACAECLRQHSASLPARRRNDTWRVEVTFGGRGSSRTTTLWEIQKQQSQWRKCGFISSYMTVLWLCVWVWRMTSELLADWLGSWFPVENVWLTTSSCTLSHIFRSLSILCYFIDCFHSSHMNMYIFNVQFFESCFSA